MNEVKIIGLDKIEKLTKDIADRLKDSSKCMEIIANQSRSDVERHFSKEEGDTGKWEPLKKRSGKALQDTGRLRSSFQTKHSKNSANVYTNVKYAGYHNFGTSRIPQRKFMWNSKEIRDLFDKTYLDFILRGK